MGEGETRRVQGLTAAHTAVMYAPIDAKGQHPNLPTPRPRARVGATTYGNVAEPSYT